MNRRQRNRYHWVWVCVAVVVMSWFSGACADDKIPPGPTIGLPTRIIVVPPPQNSVGESSVVTAGWDRVVFRNGDVLSGRLVELVPGRELRWQHPDARGLLVFAPGNVLQIKLAGGETVAGVMTGAVVRLTNGDELRGVIREMDSEKLVLQTTYAGDLTIQRPMIESVVPGAADGSVLYQGPTGLTDWYRSQGDRGWGYRDGALVLGPGVSGVVARDVKLRDRCRIEFDLQWRAHPYLLVSVYGDNPENFHGNAYVLHISGNSVQLQRGRVRGGMNMLGGGATVENFTQRGRARLGILVDKSKRSIALTVDGNVVRQWTDPAEFAGGGTWLMFMGQGQGPLRISNLVVREWDGQLEASAVERPASEDLLRLSNHDKVSGDLRGIREGRVFFQTAYATLEVPLERVLRLELATNKAERARRQASDIRAMFHGGGYLTVALEKIDEHQLVGNSENFGRQSFTRSAFRELRFAIYDETARLPGTEDPWADWVDAGN